MVLPIMTYVGRPHPRGSTLFRFQVYERVGTSLFEEICHFGLYKGPKWLIDAVLSTLPDNPGDSSF